MILKQTHFPNKGPNWGTILLFTVTVIAAIVAIKKSIKVTDLTAKLKISEDKSNKNNELKKPDSKQESINTKT